jgi:subtilisin family serine protease
VVNLSLGHPILEPAATNPLVQAVERAVRAGIVVVASAGNLGRNPETGVVGYGGLTSPGNAPSAITVGAIDTRQTTTRGDDVIPAFSSRGPTWFDGFLKPDLVAPGAQLVSTVSSSSALYLANPNLVIDTISDGHGGPAYMRFSGTSMAAAVTTGVVAQLLDANRRTLTNGWGRDGANVAPGLSPNTVKAILQYTAVDMPGYDVLTQGAGALNGEGAVRLAAAIDTRAPVDTWWLSPTVGPSYSTIGASTYFWSSRIVWGDRVIWGDALFQNDAAWAQRIVWGDRVIWGDLSRTLFSLGLIQ